MGNVQFLFDYHFHHIKIISLDRVYATDQGSIFSSSFLMILAKKKGKNDHIQKCYINFF